MIKSRVIQMGGITIPDSLENVSMQPFEMGNALGIVGQMCKGFQGIGFLTVCTKHLSEGDTQRRPGAHIDGNFFQGRWGNPGGWKVGENGPPVGTQDHARGYLSSKGGMIIASNYSSCLGWKGDFNGSAGVGGDCRHIALNDGFMLSPNTIYYGNTSFIHESIPVRANVVRTMIRVTLPEDHRYNK